MSPIRSLHEGREIRVRAMLLGHVRLGTYETPRPSQSDTFIFTSADRERLLPLARDFGGAIASYKPQGAGEEPWRLVSERDAFTALFPFADLDANVRQDFELWGRAGLKRRCDGITCTSISSDTETGEITESDADCPGGGAPYGCGECATTTRLVLLLPQTGLGLWELDTHSKIAAAHLWDQALFIAEVAQGRMNHLPIRLTYAPRQINYFDREQQRRRTTTKRVVSLSIAGDAEHALAPLGLSPDQALLSAVRAALGDGGAPALATGDYDFPPGDQGVALDAGVATGGDSSGREVGDPAATGAQPFSGEPVPPDPEQRPKVDPEITAGPYRGKRLSEIVQADRAYVEGMLAEARAKARREVIQAWLDWSSPRLVS
ncbi:MAG: recombination directionality factor [Actinomycetota bacterium]